MARTLLKLVAAGLLAFLVFWAVSNAFVHSKTVAGTKVVIKTQIGGDARSLAVARRAAREADRWLRDGFGQPISETADIRLARSGNCQWIENLAGSEPATAWSGSGGVCVYTRRRIWKRLLAGDGARNAEEVVAHELIHVAQRELGCVDEPGHQRFQWLVEGMAVYGAREALILSEPPAPAGDGHLHPQRGRLPARPGRAEGLRDPRRRLGRLPALAPRGPPPGRRARRRQRPARVLRGGREGARVARGVRRRVRPQPWRVLRGVRARAAVD